MVLSEFLAALGLKDNFSKPLDDTLKKGEQRVTKFGSIAAKQFGLASIAVGGFLATALTGVYKFTQYISKYDDEVSKLAKDLNISKNEAWVTKMAMDAMGKSMDEIKANPELLKQFKELKAAADLIRPPDMTEGLSQIRDLNKDYITFKQTAMIGAQWVGHYFLKYVQKPVETLRGYLDGLNKNLIKNIPKISEEIGKAMAWIVRLGLRVVQGAKAMWNIMAKLLDMIPDKVKIIGVALLALGKIIKMGPMGIFITLISAALLLLDDFFTYLEGGESLLGPFWKMLTDLFSGFTDSGKDAISFFTEDFLPKLLSGADSIFSKLIDTILSYVDPFLDFGVKVIDGFINLVTGSLPHIQKLIGNLLTKIVSAILKALPSLIDAGTKLIDSLLSGITSMIPQTINVALEIFDNLLNVIFDNLPAIIDAGINLIDSLILGITKSLPTILQAAIKLLDGFLKGIMKNLPKLIKAGLDLVKALIQGVVKALPAIIRAILDLLDSLIKAIVENLPAIIEMGIELVMALIEGIADALPDIILAIVDLIFGIQEAIMNNLPAILQAGIEIIFALIKGFIQMNNKIGEAIVNICAKIFEGLAGANGRLVEHGKKMVESLWNGILSMGSWLKDKVTGFASGIIDNIKGSVTGSMPSSSPAPSTGHADGGIFNKEHVARFAEGNQTEAIVPLTKPNRAAQVLAGIGKYLGVSEGGSQGANLAPMLNGLMSFIGQLSTSVGHMEQVLSHNVQSVPISNSSNVNNSKREINMKTTINVQDKSGNPQATGKAVANSQKDIIRDLETNQV